MSIVFEACSRLDSPSAELDSVYKRHLAMSPVDEKLFLNYLRVKLSIQPTKVPNVLEDVILNMSHTSPPILPFIKLFNVAVSSCQQAHEAAQVLHLPSSCSVTWSEMRAQLAQLIVWMRFSGDATHWRSRFGSRLVLVQLSYQSLPIGQSVALCFHADSRDAVLRHYTWYREIPYSEQFVSHAN
jgi:hypothetical protein